MSGAFESTLLSPPRSTNKLFMETGFCVNAGFERYRNIEIAISDGATSNRAKIQGPFDATNNPRGWIAGAATAEWCGWVEVPSASVGTNRHIFYLGAGTTTLTSNDAFTLQGYLANDIFEFRQIGSSTANMCNMVNSTFRATYSGQRIWLRVKLTLGVVKPVVEVNQVDVSASFTYTTPGTPPDWLSTNLVPTYHLTGYNWPAGVMPQGQWILGHLSATESASWMTTGRPPAWVVKGGTCAPLNTAAWTNVLSGFTTFASADKNTVSASQASGTSQASSTPGFKFVTGDKYIVVLTANLISGAVPRIFINESFVSDFSSKMNLDNGVNTIELVATGTSQTGSASIKIEGVGATSFAITLANIYQEGALSLDSYQPINVVDDATGIGGNTALLVGSSTYSNKKIWRIVDYTKTSGNEQLMGGAVFTGTSTDYIKSWTIVNAGGTTTVSLGNVSGGAQYVSGLSVPTGTTVVTLLTNTPLTTNLWCNANSTASLTHIIEGYRTA